MTHTFKVGDWVVLSPKGEVKAPHPDPSTSHIGEVVEVRVYHGLYPIRVKWNTSRKGDIYSPDELQHILLDTPLEDFI